MQHFTRTSIRKQMKTFSVTLLLVFSFQLASNAQLRNYGLVYSDNAKGDVALFGNTLTALAVFNTNTVNVTGMNDNATTGNSTFTNNFQQMLPVDVDGSVGDGGATRNSSSSDLILPAGTNVIKLARLYWGGRAVNGEYNTSLPSNKTIRIRKGTSGTYSEFAAQQFDRFVRNVGAADEFSLYQGYVDVTDFVKNNGTGTYTVGNAALSIGNGGNAGNYGGWCIVVIYENETLPYNSIRFYDGFQEVWNGGNSAITSTVTLTGLNVPSGTLGLNDAKMGFVTWEGDANFKQDFLKINDNLFSNGINPADNPFNGTISDFGTHVTTKNPNYTNQMGIDIDQLYVGTGFGILPNATSVKLEFGTELDQYFPGLFTFVIKVKEPTLALNKTVADANANGKVEGGEELTYTLKGFNTGGGNANNVVLTDTLPANITFVPGTLKVVYNPGSTPGFLTDMSNDDLAEYIVTGQNKIVRFRLGNGANATTGGIISSLDSFVVEFKATVNFPAPGQDLLPVINIARVTAASDASEQFVDDGIAIINPTIINLPVLITSFAANLQNPNTVKVNWSTSMEANSDRFEIERSYDARIFTSIGTVSAAGTSNTTKNYSITNDVTTVASPIVYYRLKQIDIDGKSIYSKVVSIKLKKAVAAFVVSPNPFSSYVNVNVEATTNESAVVKILSMAGTELVTKNVQMVKGSNFISLEELSKLPVGNYILQVNTAADRLYKQITKQ
jgi:uncharacterized repeat protein (TIGR01451 family)